MSDAHSAHLWEQGKHAPWITLVQTTNSFARNIKNRLSWNWINAKEVGLKQVFWTKTKTSRTSRCKSGAETARWITSQCSMPLAIFSLFLLSKLVGNYIDENSGPMHVPLAGWITARQGHPYRMKESYHIVSCRANSLSSMECKALSSMKMDFHSFRGFPLLSVSQIIIGESDKGTSTIIVPLHWLATPHCRCRWQLLPK